VPLNAGFTAGQNKRHKQVSETGIALLLPGEFLAVYIDLTKKTQFSFEFRELECPYHEIWSVRYGQEEGLEDKRVK